MRYWLNSPDKRADPEEFERRSRAVCEAYAAAPTLHEQGGHTVSTDEKTGMQALERAAATLPMRPGLVERREVDYVRHGTQVLTANFEVATGKVVCPTVGDTRNERDFAAHVGRTVGTDPQAPWVFVVDQLNTHQSATLIQLVATVCGITACLGVKGRSGVLKSKATRRAFLEDPTHRVRFVYTPRHASWLKDYFRTTSTSTTFPARSTSAARASSVRLQRRSSHAGRYSPRASPRVSPRSLGRTT